MKVSVIIPTYNRFTLLKAVMESLSDQDYAKNLYEIIISDNDSSDNTYQIVRDFSEKHQNKLNIKYILEKRKGATFARHSGVYNSEGEILCFCDDDGLYDKNWISKIVEVYRKYPEVVAVGTRIVIKWDKNPPGWIGKYENLLGKKSMGTGISVGTDIYVNAGSYSIKKDILYEMGGFGPDMIGEYLAGDGETGLNRRLFEKKKLIGFTDETTMTHQQFVSRNAKKKDLARRFYNNGIAKAYGEIEKKNNKNMFLNFRKYSKNCLKFGVRRMFSRQIGIDEYFRHSFEKGYIVYLLKYFFNNRFREAINLREWVLNKNYISPSAIKMSECKED